MAKDDNGNRERAIFEAALDITSAEGRLGYLKGACGEDAALLARVQALLQAHETAGGFLPERPKAGATIRIITEKAGDKIGHYKLLQGIGEGGCGVVYMAEQEEPIRRRVALKVIKLGMDTKQVIARFEAERQALALMDHPNIAKVLDAGATETGRPFFVMELVRGIKITDYCDQNHLSTEARLSLFTEVCHAIQHAHQKGVIHRDIKPSNILVTLHDGVPIPKVIDFGIAKATDQRLTDKTLFTAFEQFIGTPAYMSPEQAEMSGLDIDTRSDIYALGVLLYELLTAHTPFEQKDLIAAGLDEMRRMIREQEPPRPSTCLSTLAAADQTSVAKHRGSEPPQLIRLVKGDLDWIVMKCLEKDRTRRYETANGLAADIARHLQDEPVTARPPGRVYRLQKFVRRNKLVFAAGAAVATALIIGLGCSMWLLFRALAAEQAQSQLRQEAQAETKKSEQVARIWKDMLQGVGPSVALGRDTTLLKEILDKTAEHVGKDLKDQPEVEAELRTTLGEVYMALGQYEQAEEMYGAALGLRSKLWGTMNTNVADSLDSLGRVLTLENKLVEAQPLLLQALAVRTNSLGSEHVKVAASLLHLGHLRFYQGRPSESEQLIRQSLAMRKKLLGNEHADVAESLVALSGVLADSGQAVLAEPYAREAEAIQARVSGGEPVPIFAGSLGWVLYAERKLEQAEKVTRQELDLRRKILGAEHPETVNYVRHLALVLMAEGKLEEAEAVVRQGLPSAKTLVPGRRTAMCLEALGDILVKAGRLPEAEAAYTEMLAMWKTLLAAINMSHDRPHGHAKLANVLHLEGKLAEAETMYREGLDICQKVAPQNFEWRQWLAGDLARVLKDQGKLAKAEALYRETIDVGRRCNATNNLASLLAGLGDLLRDEGKLAEAEPLYREGLDICRTATHENSEGQQWLASGLGMVLKQQGKLAEAEPAYREAVTNSAKVWPKDRARWQWQVDDLADVLQRQGKLAEADQIIREFQAPAGQDSPESARLLVAQAGLRGRQGKWKEAIGLYTRAIELEPTNHLSYHKLAPLLVFTGDLEGYRQLCRQMLVRFTGTTNPVVADVTAKNCLLLPPSAADLPAAAGLAETAVTAGTNDAALAWFQFCKGLAEYRQAHFAEGVEWMQKALASARRPPELEVSAQIVLAMSQHQLKRPDKARSALNKALELAHFTLPQPDQGDLGPGWVDWLNAHILLREAQALIIEGETTLTNPLKL